MSCSDLRTQAPELAKQVHGEDAVYVPLPLQKARVAAAGLQVDLDDLIAGVAVGFAPGAGIIAEGEDFKPFHISSSCSALKGRGRSFL